MLFISLKARKNINFAFAAGYKIPTRCILVLKSHEQNALCYSFLGYVALKFIELTIITIILIYY